MVIVLIKVDIIHSIFLKKPSLKRDKIFRMPLRKSNCTQTLFSKNPCENHCVKSVRIGSYSGSYFPTFGLNTERYGVSLRIQSECEKIRTRITPDKDTFHVVNVSGFN